MTLGAPYVFVQYVPVQEQQCARRLVLCGGAHPLLLGKRGQEAPDFHLAQSSRMPLPVVAQEAPYPVGVGFLRAGAVVSCVERAPQLNEQLCGWVR